MMKRREWLKASAGFGVSLVLGRGARALGFSPTPFVGRAGAKAKTLVQIVLQGGLSHLDSFDPKPLAPVEIRGDFKTVPTGIPGIHFSEHLDRLAGSLAKNFSVIRSMTHGEAAHERGMHSMLTGYPPSPAITYPSLGAVISHELEPLSALPPYIAVPQANDPLYGTGYLSTKYGPFALGSDPRAGDFKVRDLEASAGIDAARMARRRRMLDALEERPHDDTNADAVLAMEAFYGQAWKLIDSAEARAAFDIKKEPQKMRDRYGMTSIGQRLLMARRLVAAGTRCITVQDGGYDLHEDIFDKLEPRLEDLDKGLAAFFEDLAEQGLLETTLVTVTTEFGRTSKINATGGRDHWPKVFSVLVSGGGLQSGRVIGASDASGLEPTDHPVSPADLAATLFTQLGIEPEKKLLTEGGRPIDLVRGGSFIRGLA